MGPHSSLSRSIPVGNQVEIKWDRPATLAELVTVLNASVVPAVSVATYSASGPNLHIVYDTLGVTGNTFTIAADVSSLQVQIGPNLPLTLDNLEAMLNASNDVQIRLCDYEVITNSLLIVFKAENTIGNQFDLATTTTGATISGVTLTGGRDAHDKVDCTLSRKWASVPIPSVPSLPACSINSLVMPSSRAPVPVR